MFYRLENILIKLLLIKQNAYLLFLYLSYGKVKADTFPALRCYPLQFRRLWDCSCRFSWWEDKRCSYQRPLTAA